MKATDLGLPLHDTATVAALGERFVCTWVTPGADFLLSPAAGEGGNVLRAFLGSQGSVPLRSFWEVRVSPGRETGLVLTRASEHCPRAGTQEEQHPQVYSRNEHKFYLFLGGSAPPLDRAWCLLGSRRADHHQSHTGFCWRDAPALSSSLITLALFLPCVPTMFQPHLSVFQLQGNNSC